ncbi:ribose 5-phosphate isomerase A [Tanacetum coccineum]
MNPPTSHNFQTQSKSFPTDMQTTRQAINNTNHPSSALEATFGPSLSYNMPQNSSPPSSSHMQTTRQAINNTNHLSSSFQPAIRPFFPYNMPQNSSPPSSSHMQTTRQAINNTNHLSSSFQPGIRPSFLYDMRQNSSSSSSSLQASVRPNVHHNSSSSSSSSRSQSLQSQPTVHDPALHQSSSSNSFLNHDQDLLSEVEINLAAQYEQNLLQKVRIIDGNGNILRTQKMTAKQVYKLNGGEKVLVHISDDYQLIKNAGGLCSRFMTLILKEPNLCPPDAKDWKECKDSCAAMLIAELRVLPSAKEIGDSAYTGEKVDKVLSAMLSVKRRTIKYRLKKGLYQQAANKLNEANGINGLDAQEKKYTDDELLAALDLLEPPENFLEHQWRVYKSHLRKPIAKKVENKRPPNDFESFHLCYKTKDGTYLQEATREMMVIANQEISSKVKELVGPEGIAEDAVVAKIAREVLNKLFGNEEPHCYGVGVTKSQISKFCCDLRRMRGEVLADENRFLKEKNMEQKLDGVYAMLKLLPAFPDLDNVASTSAAGTCDKQPSSTPSPFMDEDHYSPVMDDPSFGY